MIEEERVRIIKNPQWGVDTPLYYIEIKTAGETWLRVDSAGTEDEASNIAFELLKIYPENK